MKDAIQVIAFVLTSLLFQIGDVESFSFKCPSQDSWTIRAKSKCNSTLKYFCLYNNFEERYVEGCDGPDWDRKGSKRIFSVSFTRGKCIQERYQPFEFQTNESMSDCIYAKSLCSEEGQIVNNDDSTKNDRTCRCDYKNNYSFVKIPRHVCYCLPTEEDCSCNIKSCPVNSTLTTDYVCTSKSHRGKSKCIDTIRYSNTTVEKIQVNMVNDNLWLNNILIEPRWNAALTLCCFCLIIMFGAFILFEYKKQIINTGFNIARKWSRKKLQPSERNFENGQKGKIETVIRRTESVNTLHEVYLFCEDTNETEMRRIESADYSDDSYHESYESTTYDKTHDTNETELRRTEPVNYLDEIYHESYESTTYDKTHAEVTTDEIYYLRMIHLIFRVACPVVRMIFNQEIKPSQLQKTLDKSKTKMEKQYRKREEIINNQQWDLLYRRNKGKTVKSEDFDIGLMIFIIRTIANIQVGNLYPVQADTRTSAMLSRIQYIKNKTTQSLNGKLSAEPFNKYWDDIGQGVLKLVSSIKENITDNTENTQLIGRLFTLNPVDIDYNKLRIFISMSETYPAMILQKIISDYCIFISQSMDAILKKEKHELYHKRFITQSCCLCKTEFSTYTRMIPEKQWESLYEIKSDSDFHHCPSNLEQCSERFIPKKIDTCNLSITVPIVLNIHNILTYIIDLLYKNEFEKFLMKNKHVIYHYMEKNRCCMCCKDPSEKTFITKIEWNKLFFKECVASCQNCMQDCCKQYSVIKKIKSSNLDETLLSKLFHIAGPISVLNKIEQASFLYFLNWTVDERPLRYALLDLLSIIKDTTVRMEMLTFMDKAITETVDVQQWISTHVKYEKVTPDPPLQVILPDKDSFCIKSVQIPKDVPLPNRTRWFNDITDEENNFLKIFHVLTKVVYSVLTIEFKRLCADNVLDKFRMDIYEQQIADCHKDSHKDKHRQRIHLTQQQREQLFTPTKSNHLDFELMIYILKRKTEEEGKKDYTNHLDVINDIRREIVQHSSGVLNETRFREILTCIEKALLHFGKELYEDKITNLHHIRNIKEVTKVQY